MVLNYDRISELDRQDPIGIFDSGVGGLTVVRAFEKLLPHENLFYFGDTARYPFGPRSPEIVIEFSCQIAEFLMSHNIKMLVVACNTASSVAMTALQKLVYVPLIGVIKPGAEAAVRVTVNGKIGVIGTAGTIRSNSYQASMKKLRDDIEIFAKDCPLFVALAQEGFKGEIVEMVAEHYLSSIREQGVDTLILGCTHYPLISESIQKVMGSKVKLIDSAESTVLAIKKYLLESDIHNKNTKRGKISYVVSDAPSNFKEIGQRFLNHELGDVKLVRLK